MAKKPPVGIIGLGKFGYKFGMTLLDLGHKVLGIDYRMENIIKQRELLLRFAKQMQLKSKHWNKSVFRT